MTNHKMRIVSLLLAILAIALETPVSVKAQQVRDVMKYEIPHFDLLTEGLSSLRINKIVEDSEGYIWIATDNGLTRYDGLRSRSFVSTEQDESEARRDIITLYDDTISNCIWASTLSSQILLRIDKRTLKISELHYDIEFNDRKDTHSYVSDLTSLNDTLLLAFSPYQLNLIHKKTGENYKIWQSAKGNSVNCSSFFSIDGKHYVLAAAILMEIVEEEMTIEDGRKSPISLKPVDLDLERPRQAKVMNDSTVLFSCGRGSMQCDIATWTPRSGNTRVISSLPFTVRDICATRNDVWACTSKGLVRIPMDCGGGYRLFSTVSSKIADGNLWCIIRLRHQPIMMVGSRAGMIKMDYLLSRFTTLDFRKHSRSEVTEVTCALKDSRGSYWASTTEGLFFRTKDRIILEPAPLKDLSRNTDRVVSIVETCENDAVLIAQNNHIVLSDLDAKNSRIVYRTQASDGKIASLRTIPGHRVRIATTNTITTLDLKTLRTERYQLPNNDKIHNCHISDDDNVWYCNPSKCIVHVDLKAKKTIYYGILSSTMPTSLRHTKANGMDEIWICTRRDGAKYYLPAADTLMDFNKSKYLRTATAMDVAPDGSIWIGTESGIVHIKDNVTEEFSNTIYDIAPSFMRSASSHSVNGQILLCASTGIVEFNHTSIPENTYFPHPRVSSYGFANSVSKTYDMFTAEESNMSSDTIVMPAGVRSLKLRVSSPNYHQTESCKFQWQMDNDSPKAWHTQYLTSEINITNLDEGLHSLRMRSLDDDGFPSQDVKETYIEREVFFYETRWFHALGVVTFVLLATVMAMAYGLHTLRQKRRLEEEVAKQAGLIIETNRELRHSQEVIKKQYADLSEAKNNLETKVAERTADLEKAKHKAEESNELKSAFLASLGHEVRTPMNAIVGFAKLLQMDDCSAEERTEFAHLILESSSSMLSLIGGLLDTSRIERGVLPISMSDINISPEIKDVWRILSVEKKKPTVEFLLDLGPELDGRKIRTDRDRLRQIIINLTYNAFKFTDHGSVKVSAHLKYQYELAEYSYPANWPRPIGLAPVLLISVADTGIGIPEDKTEIIFEPFRRLVNNKLKYGGMGLGLNIVRSVAQLLGGQVWVTSKVDVGSTFYCFLPMTPPKIESPEE